MSEKSKDVSRRNPIVYCFCGILVFTLTILVGYMCHSTNTLKASQDKIVTEHVKHIAKVDSLFYEMKGIILSNDTGNVANASELLSQLQKDSTLFRREILLSQEEMNNLVELHIDKIENDYAQIGIWGGVLSVLFIIFGFFAIFKLEETKNDAKTILNDVIEQGEEAKKQIGELQSQATELNTILSGTRQDVSTLCQNKEKEFDELRDKLTKQLGQTNQDISKFQTILKEAEDKSGKYQITLENMEQQLNKLEELSVALNNVMEKIKKEAENE